MKGPTLELWMTTAPPDAIQTDDYPASLLRRPGARSEERRSGRSGSTGGRLSQGREG